jgi:hypothetical protein
MNAGGLSLGQIIATISAVGLVVSLFLAWGGADVDVPDVPALPEGAQGVPGASEALEAAEDAADATGWESQNTLDIYLAILAGLVLIGTAMYLGGYPGLPFAPAAGTFLLGVIGTVMVVYVLIDVPEGLERKIGIYVATAAVIGVTIGSFLQMRDEVAETY